MSRFKQMTRSGHNGFLNPLGSRGVENIFVCFSESLGWLIVVVRRQETLQVLVEAALTLFTVTELKKAKEWSNGPDSSPPPPPRVRPLTLLAMGTKMSTADSHQGWTRDVEGQSIACRKEVTMDLTANFWKVVLICSAALAFSFLWTSCRGRTATREKTERSVDLPRK
jgi:hypothetical protein